MPQPATSQNISPTKLFFKSRQEMNVNPRIDNIMVIIMSVPLLSLNVSEYSSPRKTTSAPKMPPPQKGSDSS